MNTRYLVLLLAATVLTLTTGCPKPQDGGNDASAVTAAPDAKTPAPEAKPAPPKKQAITPTGPGAGTLIKQTLNDMLSGLNTKDLELYTACFHPESRELEEMLGLFEEFDNTKQKVEYLNLSVEAIEGKEALVDYTLGIADLEDDSKSEKESGEFEMLLHDGHWVILDLS